jgi:hypothetical protein
MEPDGSLQCSKQPTAGHYPEPVEMSPHPHNLFTKISGVFPSGCLTRILYKFISPIHATNHAHLTIHDFIASIIFGEHYKSRSISFSIAESTKESTEIVEVKVGRLLPHPTYTARPATGRRREGKLRGVASK